MEVGVYFFTTAFSLDIAELARRAEELGFESCWVPEHVGIPVDSKTSYFREDRNMPDEYKHIVDPFVALSRAAAVTSRIKLGTSICLVAQHHPVELAKQVATLDFYSGGRVIFGVGGGWHREESEMMGGAFDHRWSHVREGVLALKELWTKDEAEYHGRFVDFPAVVSSPKPVQKPHPPVLLGSKAPNVIKRVVEWGDGWMPGLIEADAISEGRAALNQRAREAGRDPKSISVSVFGWPDQFPDMATLKVYEEAGADRVLIWLKERGPEAITEMEEIASWAFR